MESSYERQKSTSKPFTPTDAKCASIGAPGFAEISRMAFFTSTGSLDISHRLQVYDFQSDILESHCG